MHDAFAPQDTLSKPICAAPTKHGGSCGMPVLEGGMYCFQHEPDLVEERTEARRRGGINRNKPAPCDPVDLATPESRRRAIEQTIDRVRKGEEPLNTGRFIVWAISLAQTVVDQEELAERLEALEDAAKPAAGRF